MRLTAEVEAAKAKAEERLHPTGNFVRALKKAAAELEEDLAAARRIRATKCHQPGGL